MSKHYHLPLQLVTIREEGYHFFVDIIVNGHHALMLLDTGASRTVFDSSRLKKIIKELELEANADKAIGLGSDNVENFIAEVKHMDVGGLDIHDLQIGVLDLSHVNKSYKKMNLQPIAGVLGSDILVKHKAVIDLKKMLLSLEK